MQRTAGSGGGSGSVAAPALTCIAGITGEGRDGKDVVFLVAIIIGGGVKTNND